MKLLTEEQKQKRRDHYHANKQVYKDRSVEWKKNNQEELKLSRKKGWLKYTYGLSWEEFMNIYNMQKGCCDICGVFMELTHENKTKQAYVDHCHTTNTVRGLLCTHCNMGIGNFKENIECLHKAEEYLKKWHFSN